MSNQMNLPNTLNVISSPASAGGRSHSNLPGGPQLDLFGLEAAHASHSQPQAKDSEPQTNGTSGPCSPNSSAPASLQQSLANRLRARLAGNGSPEYSLTWKEWAISGQEPICALRASGHRTSANGCGGWPTPTCTEPDEQPEEKIARHKKLNERAKALGKAGPGPALSPGAAVHLSGWPTPQTAEPGGPDRPSRAATGRTTEYLGRTVEKALAGWPKCSSRDWKDTPGMATTGVNPDGTERTRLDQLPRVAHLAGWATPCCMDTVEAKNLWRGQDRSIAPTGNLNDQVRGAIPSSSPAGTEKPAALNPQFTRWLMGFPPEWLSSKVLETLSSRKSRRSS